jgi:hypothetical protein
MKNNFSFNFLGLQGVLSYARLLSKSGQKALLNKSVQKSAGLRVLLKRCGSLQMYSKSVSSPVTLLLVSSAGTELCRLSSMF